MVRQSRGAQMNLYRGRNTGGRALLPFPVHWCAPLRGTGDPGQVPPDTEGGCEVLVLCMSAKDPDLGFFIPCLMTLPPLPPVPAWSCAYALDPNHSRIACLQSRWVSNIGVATVERRCRVVRERGRRLHPTFSELSLSTLACHGIALSNLVAAFAMYRAISVS